MLNFLLIFALLNSCIELEISAPSFPDVVTYFAVSERMVGLTITYNLVGFCLASLVHGPLSEYYGRRPVMVVGNFVLAVGAVGCALAPSLEFLLLSRFIQGIGAATSAVVVSAIIADVYYGDKAAKLYGFMNAFFTAVMAISPILGGIITHHIGWRGNYGIVAIICLVSWMFLLLFLPETHRVKKTVQKSLIRDTLLDYKILLSSKLFVSAAIVPSILYGCYMAFVAVAPFIYMNEFGFDLMSYTIYQGIIVGAFSITSIFSDRISKFLGKKISIYASLILSLLCAISALFVKDATKITIIMSFISAASAIIYPIIFAKSLEIFPEIKGTASSVIMSLRYLLCSAITAFANYMYDGALTNFAMAIFIPIVVLAILSTYLINKMDF